VVKVKGKMQKELNRVGARQTQGRSEVGTRQERDDTGSRTLVMGTKQGGDCGRSGEVMGVELRQPQQAWLDTTAGKR
jgi:hypothetical protein